MTSTSIAIITMYLPRVLCLLAATVVVSASPEPRHTCVVPASGSNATDDAPAIIRAFQRCGRGGKVVFKPTTYHVNSVMNITGLEDVDIDIRGELLVYYTHPAPLFQQRK